jgi:hypothetical protein
MDLGLEILRTTGRRGKDLNPEVVRELVPEDLAALQVERGVQKAPALKLQRLSERHRNLARLLAAGKTDYEVAIITGYTPGRVSILKSDPAMQNLIKHYREEVDIIYTTVNEKLAHVAGTALEVLQDRLEDEEAAAEMTVGQLIEITKLGADRTGNGPTTKSEVAVNVSIADRLESARKRVLESRLIDAKAVEVK